MRAGLVMWCSMLVGCFQAPVVRTLPGRVAQPPPFGIVGQAMTVELVIPGSHCCDEEIVSSVATAVRDPMSDSVTHESDLDRSGAVRLTFVPQRPGLHQLTARFEPNLSLVQADVHVAEDRRDAGEVPLPASLAGCPHVDVMPSGRVLCVEQSLQLLDGGVTSPVRFEGGALLGRMAAHEGGALWLISDAGLSRWLDSDAGLVRSPDLALSVSPSFINILPGSSDALLVDYSNGSPAVEYVQVTEDDAGFSRTPWGALATRLPQWRDSSRVLSWSAMQMCSWSLDGGGRQCPGPGNAGLAYAVDPAGIWLYGGASSGSRISLSTLSGTVSMPFAGELWTPGRGGTATNPIPWDTGAFLRGVDGGSDFVLGPGLQLELYTSPGETVRSVTGRWVTVTDGTRTRLLRR